MVNPSLACEEVVNASCGFVPRVVVLVLVDSQLDETLWLQLHRLAPELRLHAHILPEREVLRLTVARCDGRVVTHL